MRWLPICVVSNLTVGNSLRGMCPELNPVPPQQHLRQQKHAAIVDIYISGYGGRVRLVYLIRVRQKRVRSVIVLYYKSYIFTMGKKYKRTLVTSSFYLTFTRQPFGNGPNFKTRSNFDLDL